MHHPHGAQRFDGAERRIVKIHEKLISLQQCGEFPAAFRRRIGKQKPDVLHRRSVQHIVEVDCEKPLAAAVEYVRPVEIPVNTDERIFIGENPFRLVHDVEADRFQLPSARRMHHAGIEQAFQRAACKGFRRHGHAVLRRILCPCGVDEAEKRPDFMQ